MYSPFQITVFLKSHHECEHPAHAVGASPTTSSLRFDMYAQGSTPRVGWKDACRVHCQALFRGTTGQYVICDAERRVLTSTYTTPVLSSMAYSHIPDNRLPDIRRMRRNEPPSSEPRYVIYAFGISRCALSRRLNVGAHGSTPFGGCKDACGRITGYCPGAREISTPAAKMCDAGLPRATETSAPSAQSATVRRRVRCVDSMCGGYLRRSRSCSADI